MDLVALGTPLGLAFASGLNAYLPMLAFAIAVRWLHLYGVNPHFAFTTQSWFIAALVILILGGVLAALSHASKLTARFVSTITSAGFLNIVLSLVEDVLVLIIILLSLFAATVMFILLVLFILVFVPRYLRSRNTWVKGPWR